MAKPCHSDTNATKNNTTRQNETHTGGDLRDGTPNQTTTTTNLTDRQSPQTTIATIIMTKNHQQFIQGTQEK